MDDFRLEVLRRAIRDHLGEHGGRKWKLLIDRFGDVPHATFWRTVKAVRSEAVSPPKAEDATPQDAGADRPFLFPSYCEPLEKLAEYEGLIRSAQELINHAKGPRGKIKNWQMHAKGVALRESLVRNQVEVMRELASLDFQACFDQAVFDLLGELAPDLRQKFIARYNELSALSGEELRAATEAVRPKAKKTQKGTR